MKDGFLKVAAATPAIRVADCPYNAEKVRDLAREAADKGVEVIVFPELCLTGYTCGDLFGKKSLLLGGRTGAGMAAGTKRRNCRFYYWWDFPWRLMPTCITAPPSCVKGVCWDWCRNSIYPITVNFMSPAFYPRPGLSGDFPVRADGAVGDGFAVCL